MLFLSYSNLELFPFVAILTVFTSAVTRKLPKYRDHVLLIFIILTSITSYIYNAEKYIFLFLGSVIFNVLTGWIISSVKNEKIRKAVFIVAVTTDVIVLSGYKFMSFQQSEFLIPFGLSFFTFREISYMADVYTRKVEPMSNPLGNVAYIVLFTQLQSGPIIQYKDYIEADENGKKLTNIEWANCVTGGVQRIMIGFAKKMLIANTLNSIVNYFFSIEPADMAMPTAWFGAICFSLQLYYDFSGYSDIAIGFTNLLGYNCRENFNYPYASGSITEFWRRWHISLGEWFKNYVYIPLGGSRKSTPRIILNLFVVWLLTGLWHGSRFNFVIWGMIHFAFAATEHFTGVNKSKSVIIKIAWRFVSMIAIVVAWVMFRAENVTNGLLYIKAMFVSVDNGGSPYPTYFFRAYWKIVVVALIFSLPVSVKLKEKMRGKNAALIYDIIKPISH